MSLEGGNSNLTVLNETACRMEAEWPHVTESQYLHTKVRFLSKFSFRTFSTKSILAGQGPKACESKYKNCLRQHSGLWWRYMSRQDNKTNTAKSSNRWPSIRRTYTVTDSSPVNQKNNVATLPSANQCKSVCLHLITRTIDCYMISKLFPCRRS